MRTDDEKYREMFGVLERFVAEENGRIVGGGLFFSSEDSKEMLIFSMHIHPDYQNGDLPTQMQTYLLTEIDKRQPIKIAAEPLEDQTYRVQLLGPAGFELIMRFPRSQLDVTGVEVGAYTAVIDKLEQQSIQFATLTERMEVDPNWQNHVWQLFNKILVDIPAPEPEEPWPFEQYAKYYEGDSFQPNSWTFALDTTLVGAEQYVGMCVVNLMESRPDAVFAGITGTVRSHRRRKIATALKVKSVQYVQQVGRRYIVTDNEENNPMYDLNIQLGFQPLPAWLYYEKKMAE